MQTTDEALLEGRPVRWWFDRYVADVHGLRNLWVGPLLRFAWADQWRGHTVAGRAFRAGPGLTADMVDGTRQLLASPRLPAAA